MFLDYDFHSSLKACHNVATISLHQPNSKFVILNIGWIALPDEITQFAKEVSFLGSIKLHYRGILFNY